MAAARVRFLRKRLGSTLAAAIGAMLAALVVIALAQIVLRYFFSNSLVWAEEASVILLLLMAWVGAARLWLVRGHVAVDIFTKALSPSARSRFRLGCDVAAIPVGLMTATFAWQTAVANAGMELAGLNIDSAWKYAPVILGGVLLALAGAVNVAAPPDDGAAGGAA